MLLIVAVLGVFLVNINALLVYLDSAGGILTSEVEKVFKNANSELNRGMKWDVNFAKGAALSESLKRGGTGLPLVIHHKWKAQDIKESGMHLEFFADALVRDHGMWVPFLPANKTSYGCNGILNITGQEITTACVYYVDSYVY